MRREDPCTPRRSKAWCDDAGLIDADLFLGVKWYFASAFLPLSVSLTEAQHFYGCGIACIGAFEHGFLRARRVP